MVLKPVKRTREGPSKGWLQSNHYGIETLLRIHARPQLPMLQSNHYGIETRIPNTALAICKMLQSNHYGIETQILFTFSCNHSNNVAIEPLWY